MAHKFIFCGKIESVPDREYVAKCSAGSVSHRVAAGLRTVTGRKVSLILRLVILLFWKS